MKRSRVTWLVVSMMVAGAVLSSTPASAVPDLDPPDAVLSSFVLAPPSQATFTAQDLESGLASIIVTVSANADTVVPPFVVGTTDPLLFTSTRIDQTQPFTIAFQLQDVAGNSAAFRFLLPPAVPEPATLLLLATGLAGVAVMRRRRG